MKNKGEMLIETIFSSLIFIIVLLTNVYTIRNIHIIEKKQIQKLKDMEIIQNVLSDIKGFSREKIENIICNNCSFSDAKEFSEFIGLVNFDLEGSITFNLYIDRGVAFYSINNMKDFVILEK